MRPLKKNNTKIIQFTRSIFEPLSEKTDFQ